MLMLMLMLLRDLSGEVAAAEAHQALMAAAWEAEGPPLAVAAPGG
jgi:hypothetical protein